MLMQMNRKLMVAILLFPILLVGCAGKQGNDQALGAGTGLVGGALLGCIAGAMLTGSSDGCETGAAIGAATGAIVGWGVVKFNQDKVEKVRSQQQDRQIYGLAGSTSSAQIKIRQGLSTPGTVKPGQQVKITTDYSVVLPGNMADASVSEAWVLKKDNKVLANGEGLKNTRQAGGWSSDASLDIPQNASAGTYVVEHKVQTGNSYDIKESAFVVSL